MENEKTNTDCRGCKDRNLGCHDTCETFKKWREEREKIKKARELYNQGVAYDLAAKRKNSRRN